MHPEERGSDIRVDLELRVLFPRVVDAIVIIDSGQVRLSSGREGTARDSKQEVEEEFQEWKELTGPLVNSSRTCCRDPWPGRTRPRYGGAVKSRFLAFQLS